MSDAFIYTHLFAPDSTAIDRVFYNEYERTLVVVFTSGAQAGYKNVPLNLFNSFQRAPSAGRFYAYDVKGVYGGVSADWTEFLPLSTEKNKPKPEPEGEQRVKEILVTIVFDPPPGVETLQDAVQAVYDDLDVDAGMRIVGVGIA